MFFNNKSKNTIFVIWENGFSLRDYKRLGIEEYIQNEWDVKIIICEPVLNPRTFKLENYKSLLKLYDNIFICNSIFQILKKLFLHKPKWTFDFATSISKENYFKRIILLASFSIFSKRVLLNLFTLPEMLTKKKIISFNLNFLKKIIFQIARIPWYLFKPYKIVVSGLKDFKKYGTRAICAHNLDYDLYLENIDTKKNKSKIALFLDSDEPFHDDFTIKNASPEVKVNSYFEDINFMFMKISQIFDLEVLIQLHPRANRIRSSKYYENNFSKEDTASQISNSKLVLGHCSTALQLAVLYQKPIILLRTRDWIPNGTLDSTTNAFSENLDLKIYTIKEIENLRKLPEINRKMYKNFIDNYIKFPGSADIFSWEIISIYLKKDNKNN